MLPPFLGALLLMGTAAVVLLTVAVAVVARMGGRPQVARGALLAGAGVSAVYGFFWVLGVVLAPRQVLAPGEEISFCGLDCHLHVSVRRVRTEPYLGVTVRFASNAVRAPEWPAELRFRLRDRNGHEVAPTNAIPDSALRAGEHWDYELRFAAPAQPDGSSLIVTWNNGLDLLVPGAGNPLVQRQRRLALPPAGGA